jgi:ABC-type phosphate transport system permease subunit
MAVGFVLLLMTLLVNILARWLLWSVQKRAAGKAA